MVSLPIPESFIFQLLSKFPSQSYKIVEREVTPQNYNTDGYFNSKQTIKFNLNAAPNEFALADSCFLETGLWAEIALTTTTANRQISSKDRPAWRPGLAWISNIRESVNSGSMVTYDLSAKKASNWYNCLRGALTRTPVFYRSGLGTFVSTVNAPVGGEVLPYQDIYAALPDADYMDLEDLARSGFCNRSKRLSGIRTVGNPANSDPNRDTGLRNGFKTSQVPLTALGSIWQSNSVIPLGLFSTYSDSSYSLEIGVADPADAIGVPGQGFSTPDSIYAVKPRITLKLVRVLDNQLMDAILTLFNRSQAVEVIENVKVPVSLQLNTLKYTFHQFTLDANRQEYHLNIPTTAASLRGFAFRIVPTLIFNDINQGNTESGLPFCDNTFWENKPVVTKFHFKAGSECIMEKPVEQEEIRIGANVYSYNPCPEFFAKQAKKTGHLFSLLHHSKQAKSQMQGIEQFSGDSSAPPVLAAIGGTNYDRYAPPMYANSFNLENVNHFENNNMASGLDLRDIGSYQIILKVGVLSTTNNEGRELARTELLGDTYTMLLINVEDQILEISKSGVSDVTSQVL